jgi:hypothetical protein
MATLERYRRRDTGAVVQARRATEHEVVTHGTVWRELRDPHSQAVLTDALGRPLRKADGEHEIEVEEGDWLILQGDAASTMSDEGFKAWAVPVESTGPTHKLGIQHTQSAQEEADAAVAAGDRYIELSGAGSVGKDGKLHEERVQLHAAVVHHYNGRDDLALALLTQPAMRDGYPKTVEDLLAHALEYVDGATLTALERDQREASTNRLLAQALGEDEDE